MFCFCPSSALCCFDHCFTHFRCIKGQDPVDFGFAFLRFEKTCRNEMRIEMFKHDFFKGSDFLENASVGIVCSVWSMKRQIPFSTFFESIVWIAVENPFGPHRFMICSGLVQTSHIRPTGALNFLVVRTARFSVSIIYVVLNFFALRRRSLPTSTGTTHFIHKMRLVHP